MSNSPPTKLAIITATLFGLLLSSGCASLTTKTMGLDDYEIPKGQFAHASIIDANGIPQLHPQSPPAELSKISLPDWMSHCRHLTSIFRDTLFMLLRVH